jgi:hypothetical protein
MQRSLISLRMKSKRKYRTQKAKIINQQEAVASRSTIQMNLISLWWIQASRKSIYWSSRELTRIFMKKFRARAHISSEKRPWIPQIASC